MALNIIINKVSVAASFAAGATVATAVASGGTTPYVYSLATGGDKFAINSSTGVVTTIAAMDITNIASFSVTAIDSTTGTALTGTSDVTYPPIQAAIRSKFDRTNVIYKITKDIDLGHGVLTIPEGCTLDFQGGSFTNGTIVGNNTNIEAALTCIFRNIILNNTWLVEFGHPEWFYDKNDDYRPAIQKSFNYFTTTVLLDKQYLINSCTDEDNNIALILPKGHSVKRVAPNVDSDFVNGLKISESINPNIIIKIDSYSNLENISIIGNAINDYSKNISTGISSNSWVHNCNFINCNFLYLDKGIDIASYENRIYACKAVWCNIGFYFHGLNAVEGTSTNLISCSTNRCKYNAYKFDKLTYSSIIGCAGDATGYDTEDLTLQHNSEAYSYYFKNCSAITMLSCGSEVSAQFMYIYNLKSSSITNCKFYVNRDTLTECNYIKIDLCERLVLSNITIEQSKSDQQRTGIINLLNCTYGEVVLDNIYIMNQRITKYNFKLPNNTDSIYYEITYNIPKQFGESKFRNAPYLNQFNELVYGKQFYDTTLSQPVYYSPKYGYCLKADGNGADQKTYGDTSQRPTTNQRYIDGTLYYDTSLEKPIFGTVVENDIIWKEYDRITAGTKRYGNNNDTPSLDTGLYIGFQYYNSQNHKPIFVDGASEGAPIWMEADGVKFGTKRFGSLTDRPTSINIGFVYFDTSLNKPIWWTGDKWVDATGATV